MAKENKIDVARIIKLLIGLIFMFLLGNILPTWGPVTRLGVQVICIFVSLVFLASTGFSFIFSATLALFAIQLTGYLSGAEIIAQTWGGSMIYQLILVYALCQGLVDCGAGDVIARYLITRKWAQGRPMLFTFMLQMASIFAGAFLGLGGIVFYYKMLDAIRRDLNYAEDSDWMKFNVFGVYISACVGMSVIPYKGIPLIVFGSLNAMISQFGVQMNFVFYMLAMIVFGILAAIVFCLLLKFVFRVDMSGLTKLDVTKMEGMSNTKLNKQQAIVTIVFAISILYGVVIALLPAGNTVTDFINGITQTTWFAICLAVLCVIRVDGKPAVNPITAFGKGVDYNTIFAMCGFSLIGTLVSSADAGIQDWVSGVFGSVLSSNSFPVFFLIVLLFTLIFTNFMSNTAIGMIAVALSAPFLGGFIQDSGINVTMFAAGLMMADMYAFLTPSASGSAPILHGQKCVMLDRKFLWTKGLIVCAVHFIMIWGLFTIAAYVF